MNNVVCNIIKEAGFSIRDDVICSPYIEDSDISDLLEDFKNGIIDECVKVIIHGSFRSGGFTGPKTQAKPYEIAEMIKHHFDA